MIPWLVACAEDRALVSVPTHTVASPAEVDAGGAAVALTEAAVTLSDWRFEAPPEVAWLPPLVSSAYAHPGHDFDGAVSGELAGTWTLDLLAATELGTAGLYEGAYATARVGIAPPVRLAGTAITAGGARPFRFTLAPDQALTGIPFEFTVSAAAPPSGLAVGVDLGHALSFVDWAAPDTDGDGVLTEADGAAVANTATFGVVATPTWSLRVEE